MSGGPLKSKPTRLDASSVRPRRFFSRTLNVARPAWSAAHATQMQLLLQEERKHETNAGVVWNHGSGCRCRWVCLTVDSNRRKSAAGFDPNNWPNLAAPAFAASTFESYGQRAYWISAAGSISRSAVGKTCQHCSRTTVTQGFVRDGEAYCCAGCANKTACTCGPLLVKSRP